MGLVNKLRSNAKFNCPVVAIIESAPGIQASHIERYLREAQIPDLFVMSERKGYIEGVPKTDKITEEYVYELQRVLYSDYIAYANDIFVYDKTVVKEKQKLETMMENLRRVPIRTTTEYGHQKYKITAKVNSAGPDDLLIALCMILYWRTVFWTDPTGKYSQCKGRIQEFSNYSFPI